MKYYWILVQWQPKGTVEWCYEESVISNIHPFEHLKKVREMEDFGFTILTNWKELTKKEFMLFG